MKNPAANHHQFDLAQRLESVIETAIDGIITISDNGIVESINPAGADLFGYDIPEILGQNIKMLMPSPDRERHDGYINNYKKTGAAKIIGIGREVHGRKKDGTIFPLRLAVSEVQLEGRRIFTGVVHDLTNVKEAEAKINKLNEELEQMVSDRTEELAEAVNKLLAINQRLEHEIKEREAAEKALRLSLEKEKELNEMKTRFVSMASHQFRTPLSSILSSSELIDAYKTETQQPKREKHVNRIKASVKTMTEILNDFLSLSKLEEGKLEQEPVEFHLSTFFESVIDEIQGILKPGQHIRHEVKKDGDIYLDKKFLKNILLNLLSNAIKYSENDQPIDCHVEIADIPGIGTRKPEQELRITVADKGVGIPEEAKKHLFTRFFRAQNVENVKGTGLGLNIVRRYLNLMGGTIEFESQEGVGTTFMVYIPLNNSLL